MIIPQKDFCGFLKAHESAASLDEGRWEFFQRLFVQGKENPVIPVTLADSAPTRTRLRMPIGYRSEETREALELALETAPGVFAVEPSPGGNILIYHDENFGKSLPELAAAAGYRLQSEEEDVSLLDAIPVVIGLVTVFVPMRTVPLLALTAAQVGYQYYKTGKVPTPKQLGVLAAQTILQIKRRPR